MNQWVPEEALEVSPVVALRPTMQEDSEEGWCGMHVVSVDHPGAAEYLVSGNAVQPAQAQGQAAVT